MLCLLSPPAYTEVVYILSCEMLSAKALCSAYCIHVHNDRYFQEDYYSDNFLLAKCRYWYDTYFSSFLSLRSPQLTRSPNN